MPTTAPRVHHARTFLTALAASVALGAVAAPLALAAPSVTGLSVPAGSTRGGDSTNVLGSGFDTVTGVTIGGAKAEFDVLSPGLVNVQAPAHAAGSADVVVTTAEGASANTPADDFLYVDRDPLQRVPYVAAISDASGPANGGNALTITGSNLSEAMFVAFRSPSGAIAAGTNLVRTSDTQLTVTAPAGSGRVQVIVTAAFHGPSLDTPADDYRYEGTPDDDGSTTPGEDPVTEPVVAGVPRITKVSGGAVNKLGGFIFIQGRNFRGVRSVQVGNKQASRVTEVFDTFIAAQVPPNTTGKHVVIVTNKKGASAETARTFLTYAKLF